MNEKNKGKRQETGLIIKKKTEEENDEEKLIK